MPSCFRFLRQLCIGGMAALSVLAMFSLVWPQDTKPSPGVQPAAQQAKQKRPVSQPELYAAEPAALTPAQCGQCHLSLFRNLKEYGGRHRFSCQGCHTTIHAYSPAKGNWQELMPKCGDCHAPPHGTTLVDCQLCHANPHAIGRMPMSKALQEACSRCHSQAAAQLAQFPSAHSRVSCATCHTNHGYKPDCSACHKPHLQGQDTRTCASACHPVHMPRQISFGFGIDVKICSACHGRIYEKWSKTPSRHGAVNCSECHKKHRSIPNCNECHAQPHSEAMLQKYPKCLTCHQDAHDLPVK